MDKRAVSPLSESGTTEQPAAPGTRQVRRSAKRRLLAPLARFFGWWAGMFAFLAAFSVCPFCGQAGCAGGPAFAGLLGGISAFFMSALHWGVDDGKPRAVHFRTTRIARIRRDMGMYMVTP